MARRGFGVAGALDHSIIRILAREVEAEGYAAFWVNDTPNGDGLAALAAAAEVTSSVVLAVGVIPADRRPGPAIAATIKELGLPLDRLVIGVGAGGTRRGGLELVRTAVAEIKQQAGAPVFAGALGPRMCRLAAEHADGALLNWLTPAKAVESRDLMIEAARANGRPRPVVAGYVRTALGAEALPRLQQEATRYERIPQYGRHFQAMGVSGVETSVVGSDRSTVQSSLRPFDEVLDETVVRAITADDTTESYLALVKAAAP